MNRLPVLLFIVAMGVGRPAVAAVPRDTAWSSRALTAGERAAMTPKVWRRGCPVGLDEIRRVTVQHWTYTGRTALGAIDVHRDVSEDVIAIFRDLYEGGFRINKIVPIEKYDGSDDRSIDDDNTSAFNCRAVTGGSSFSQHSYGTAIDLNPYRNPYVRNGKAQQRPGIEKYVKRDPAVVSVGVIFGDGPVVEAFAKRGWKWGGDWKNPIDYQHFSTSGS